MSAKKTAPKKAAKKAAKPAPVPRLEIVEEGKEGTSIAARLPVVLVKGVREAAKLAKKTDPAETMSSIIRRGIEHEVRSVHSAAGQPWPPISEEQPLPAT